MFEHFQVAHPEGYDTCCSLRLTASRWQPMFGTRCVSRHSSFGVRQPVSQIMHGPGPRRPCPAQHCGDWCTPLVTTLELQTQCSPLFVLCTQNFLKLIAEVLTVHTESLYEQSTIIVLCSSLSTSDVITFSNTQHRLHSLVCPPLHCPQTQNASFVIFSDTD